MKILTNKKYNELLNLIMDLKEENSRLKGDFEEYVPETVKFLKINNNPTHETVCYGYED